MSYELVSRTRVSLHLTSLFNKKHYVVTFCRIALLTLIQEW
jgi:hypothetical protein